MQRGAWVQAGTDGVQISVGVRWQVMMGHKQDLLPCSGQLDALDTSLLVVV